MSGDIKIKGTGEIWYSKRKVWLITRAAFVGGIVTGFALGALLQTAAFLLSHHLTWIPTP
jgi:hypothetical protein